MFSLPLIKGFSVFQCTGSTLDVSLPFVVKHDWKANIREGIANIPADTLMRVMANTRNRFNQCMNNGDVIFLMYFQNCVRQNFKCVWNINKTFMIYKTYFIAFWKKGCYVAASCISNSQVTKFNFQVCHRLNKNSFKSGQIYIKDAPCAKTNAKSIFRFCDFQFLRYGQFYTEIQTFLCWGTPPP